MVKNYLKSVKDITAPLNWKSAPDSPETQLAYVTQPEIDMLVEANLHDSMDGKPNVGPNGIMSLDGGGSYKRETRIGKKRSTGARTGASKVSTTSKTKKLTSSEVKKRTEDRKQGKKTEYKPSAWAKKKIAENKAKKTTTKKDTKKDSIVTKVKNVIMGGTPTGDPDAATKKTWEAAGMVPAGQHKRRTQYDRLVAKYGEGWKDTVQAQEMRNYLAGVPVERGGGLGAKDPNYGGGAFDMEGITAAQFKEAEAERQRMLMKVSRDLSKPTGLSSKFGKSFYDPKTGKMTGDSRFYYGNPKERQDRYGTNIYSGMNEELAFAGLNPSQKQNFIRQLIAADPSLGNKYGKDVYGSSVGKFLKGIMPYTIPGGGLIKQLLPEQDKQEYQTYGDDNQLFYDTSVPDDPKTRYTGLGS